MGIAEFIIGRAFARPVGSTHPTDCRRPGRRGAAPDDKLRQADPVFPLKASPANRGFAGATAAGHFARVGLGLGHLLRAGPVPVQFAPAGPSLGDVARAGSLLAHFARAGGVGAFARVEPLPGHLAQPVPGHLVPWHLASWHLAQPVLGHLVRAARIGHLWAHLVPAARPVPAHLPRPPTLGIASTEPQRVADEFRSRSDCQLQERQQPGRPSARPLQPAAKPEWARLIEWLASTDRGQAETAIGRAAKP
jgi:hypothetical protein